MKKTLKTLSVVAFGAMLGISGYTIATNTTNTLETQEVSTYLTGDITTPEGVEFYSQQVSLSFDDDNSSTTTTDFNTYTGTLKISASQDIKYSTSSVIEDSKNSVQISATIEMEESYVYTAGDEYKIAMVISFYQEGNTSISNDLVDISGFSYDSQTKTFTLTNQVYFTPGGSEVYNTLAITDTTYQLLFVNDPYAVPVAPGAQTGNLDVINTNFIIENTKTFATAYLNPYTDLGIEFTEEQTPYYYDNLNIDFYDSDANDTTDKMQLSFTVHYNGNEDEIKVGTTSNDEAALFKSYLYLPYTDANTSATTDDEYGYYIVDVSNQPSSDSFTTEGSSEVYELADGTLAQDFSYTMDLNTTGTHAVTKFTFSSTVQPEESQLISLRWMNGQKTGATIDNAFIYSQNISTLETTELDIQYEKAFINLQLYYQIQDSTGATTAQTATISTMSANEYSWQTQNRIVEPWTFPAWATTTIVLVSLVAIVGVGAFGYWYSHKHHLKGKYDHHHLDRLKAHVAKLEKTVKIDDQKAAEWDKAHAKHKDTKSKK